MEYFRIIRVLSKWRIFAQDLPNFTSLHWFLRISLRIVNFIFAPFSYFQKSNYTFATGLSNCLTELGPIYIKFGQTISTRPDLVGIEIAQALQTLQDSLPAFPSELAKANICNNFKVSISDLFLEFEDSPIAAASIAQVHKAKLHSGEYVAVKVLRPNIEVIYRRDIKTLYKIARLLTRLIPRLVRLKLESVVQVFEESMKCEMDLRLEASNSSWIKDNLKNDHDVYIPIVHWNLTCKSVLTSEWIDGCSIYDIDKIKQLGQQKIARNIATTFFNQAYRDGLFHADLHPGNILITKDGKVALLDFGIVGYLDDKNRFAIAEILSAIVKKDYMQVAKIHLNVGYIPQDTDLYRFARSCRSVSEPILGLSSDKISIGKLLSELFKITEEFGMETQPQLLLLQKTMVVVEGIGRSLHIDANMWQLIEPWMIHWAQNNLSLKAKFLRNAKKILSEAVL